MCGIRFGREQAPGGVEPSLAQRPGAQATTEESARERERGLREAGAAQRRALHRFLCTGL
jgi:hypothetical protein